MKLVEDLGSLKPNYFIITGDGRTELHVLRGLSKKFNGHDIILYFPSSPLPKEEKTRNSGLSALNFLKCLPRSINSIIYIVDRDAFNSSTKIDNQIQDKLRAIGIGNFNMNPIQNAYLFNYVSGGRNIILYCIISGTETCIEEEVVELIKIKWRNVEIDLSGTRDSRWIKRIKKEIRQLLKEKNVKNIEALIVSMGKINLELAFPNIWAVFKRIEEENQIQ